MMKMKKLVVLIALFALVPFALAACGGAGDDDPAADAATSEPATDPAGGIAEAGEPTVNVRMGEWWFEVDRTSVPAGEIVFEVENVGKIEHEFLVLATDLPADELPVEGSEVDVTAAGELHLGDAHTHADGGDTMNDAATGSETSMVALVHSSDDEDAADRRGRKRDADHADAVGGTHLDAGESDTYAVELEPGRYVLFCNLPGHYESGQQVVLEVAPSA